MVCRPRLGVQGPQASQLGDPHPQHFKQRRTVWVNNCGQRVERRIELLPQLGRIRHGQLLRSRRQERGDDLAFGQGVPFDLVYEQHIGRIAGIAGG